MSKKKTIVVMIEGEHEFDVHVKKDKKKGVTKYKLHRSNNPVWTDPKELVLTAKVDDEFITIGDTTYDASSFGEMYTMMQAIIKNQKILIAKREYRK
jgi:hypothetical protein